jgi:hypothetical protein
MKEKRFTSEELLSIAKVMEPVYRNETYEEILESLKRSEEDFRMGRTISHQELMKQARARLEQRKNEVEYSDLSKKDFENLQDYLLIKRKDKYDHIQMMYFEKYRDTGFMKYFNET